MPEPWVNLASGWELRDWSKSNEIAYNQEMRQREKHRFYQLAFDFLTENRIHGDYWEFGCHRARTFRMALTEARKHNINAMSFYAFDSFAGLPEPSEPSNVVGWNKGALATSETEFRKLIDQHGIYADRVHTVPGFYADSLKSCSGLQRPALITVDCDLYESASDVFRFIAPYLQPGCVLYLDDWFSGYKGSSAHGVRRAFNEFEGLRHLPPFGEPTFTEFLPVGWWGKSYLVEG